MMASVCMSTYNKAKYLPFVLDSIVCQCPPFEWEVIVIDDGSEDDTSSICSKYKIKYIPITRKSYYRNPSVARNVAYKAASGRVLICQSDDVIHLESSSIERLVSGLNHGTFSIATVFNTDEHGNGIPHPNYMMTGPTNRRPFFFLGAAYRSDMYKVGGCDERYIAPGYDDDALGNALIYGLNLQPNFVDVVGHHLDHSRPSNLLQMVQPSRKTYEHRFQQQQRGQESWFSPGAPWMYREEL